MNCLRPALLLTVLAGAGSSSAVAQETVQQAVDPLKWSGPAWPPYLVGALIGVLCTLTFLISNKPLGASTAYARIAGLLGLAVASKHTRSLHYFRTKPPRIGWEVMLVVGVVIGGYLAAWQGDELTGRWVPALWAERFGEDTAGFRLAAAFVGGILMSFGARLAGGCTSGHGISGALQLSVGSWVASVCFFIGGIAAAMLLYLV